MSVNTADDFSIRAMTAADYDVVAPFLIEHFYATEPLCQTTDEDVSKIDEQEDMAYHMSMIQQGTSLVIVDASDRIVGLALAGVQYASDLEMHRLEAEQMPQHFGGRLMRMFSQVERKANVFERYNVDKALYLHMITVDQALRGRSLGTRLNRALLDMARDKGFPLMLAYCTGSYSKSLMEATGMECAYAQRYEDYKDEQGNVVFHPAAPHTQLSVMAMKL